MKRIFTLIVCSILLGIGSMYAQQIKGDFDKQSYWGVQTSFGGGADPSFTDEGITPHGWGALNVTQMGLNFPLVFGEEGRTGTGKSVKMMNRKLGAFGIGANSPSYVTLGQPWVYADIVGVMSQLGDKKDPDDSNGGSLGGINFTYRPDSIAGYFKREHGEQNPNEIAQIIVYSWIGTCKSYSPIGDGLDVTENLPKVGLIDRDVDVLGIQNGGKPASGITIIGKQIYTIEGNLTDWTRISAPVNYTRKENPMKLNVILTSADYFNRPNIGAENKLWADDVRFIYNSKLKSITLDGKELERFDEDTMVYVLPAADASKAVVAKAYGKDAKVTISDLKDSKRTITVTDESAAGVKTNTYTLLYKGAPAKITWNTVSPDDCVYGTTIDIKPVSANTEGFFSYEINNPKVAEAVVGNKLHFIGVGEVKVVARQAAGNDYSPSVSDTLTLTVKKAPLIVGAKDIERVYKYADDKFEFVYDGLKNNDADAIDRVITVKPTASIPEQTLPNGKVLKTSKGVYVGEYIVTVTGAESPYYEITYKQSKLKVTPVAEVVIGIKAASVDEGKDLPKLVVDYSKLIGEDKTDPTLVFSKAPTLKTNAVKGSPAGKYDITFDTEGAFTDVALKNYKVIKFAEKGTLTINRLKTQPEFDALVSEVKGMPEATYEYAGHSDVLGTIEVIGTDGKKIDPARLSFKVSNTTAFGIEENGGFRLWGLGTGEVDITVTVNATDSTLAVSKLVGRTTITKKAVVAQPKDFALSSGDFQGNFADDAPVYVKGDGFIPGEFDLLNMQGAFKMCPALTVETPDGELVLEADEDNNFTEDAVTKLHALPSGKYAFTVKGGSSDKYDYTFDNSVKGMMLVPAKSVVEIKGIDGLAYGRKESFKPEIKANGNVITEYTLTTNHIEEITNSGQQSEYNVLTVGTDTLTFVIPATDMTLEETYQQIVTVNKAQLKVTPKDVTCEEGKIIIPEEYEFIYEGFVNNEDKTSLNILPIAICQVTEDAKEGDSFAIFLTGGYDANYDLIYGEGKFNIIKNGSGIETNNPDTLIRVYASHGNLYIDGNENADAITVYTVQGTLVAQYKGHETVVQTKLSKNTVYIVRVGNYVTRVMMR